ncbi:reverse transcriptase-like protein [Haloarcula sp. CBA1130]|uniref:ribonuclease HI family protein n=1 Tax=unclassified Haloarcula TaxID=2624677 RepID=UPI001247A6B6|nr:MULTISPECIES: ribonuclease HI family protein [unclassified Haloarcula]KAA9395835.1 reverse transcriptase-like protein [Haloarcula sp. CBA1129]KAA9400235.1 reverse transcriptase-like protein [Haloarcula sp. CBA1130]
MDRHNEPAADRERLPSETLSPLATRIDELLALYRYELTPAIDAINGAVAGYGGLFDPETSPDEIRAAIGELLESGPPPAQQAAADAAVSQVVLYVDGSAHSNGPAGAGAVIQADETQIASLGRPVGSRTNNNVAEYAALHLGLQALAERCDPESVEIRIDSMTVINHIWGDSESTVKATPYSAAITDYLSTLPAHEWTHLADSDPNPADAQATVGADIAALGPG